MKCKRKKERSLKNKQPDAFVRDEGMQYKSGQFYGSAKLALNKNKCFYIFC